MTKLFLVTETATYSFIWTHRNTILQISFTTQFLKVSIYNLYNTASCFLSEIYETSRSLQTLFNKKGIHKGHGYLHHTN